MSRPNTILIAGPTASGKSRLAMALAERFGGVVINTDSMQVYEDLRILSARPSCEDEARVPHRLYGHIPGSTAYSAGRFLADAEAVIEEARGMGRVPIFVGGTGLYFKVLTEGLSPIPQVPDAIRQRWREAARQSGPELLYRLLETRDPATAGRLKATDPQRIVRALEVLDATGRGLSDWHGVQGRALVSGRDCLRLVMPWEITEAGRRSDQRFEVMLREGALAEVRTLAARQYSPELPVMRALGVRPLLRHLAGKIDLAAAAKLAKTETRQYIKRQITWLNGHMMSWNVVDAQYMETMDQLFLPFIDH